MMEAGGGAVAVPWITVDELLQETRKYLPVACEHGAVRPSECDRCIGATVRLCDDLAVRDAAAYAELAAEDRVGECVALLERSPWSDPALSALLSRRGFPLICFTSDTYVASVARKPSGWSSAVTGRMTVALFRQHAGPFTWRARIYSAPLWPGPVVDRDVYVRMAQDLQSCTVEEHGVKRVLQNPERLPVGPFVQMYAYVGAGSVTR